MNGDFHYYVIVIGGSMYIGKYLHLFPFLWLFNVKDFCTLFK
jgi:hypothetical protein